MNRFICLFLFSLCFIPLYSQQADTTKTEKALRVVPLVTSTPLMGWGFGLSSSYLYSADQSDASKSQLLLEGQYTTTESYSILARNNLWLKDNKYFSSTNVVFSSINNEFDDEGLGNVRYNINTIWLAELFMLKVARNFYVGAPLTYKHVQFDPLNDAGEGFIDNNGIENETTGGFGLAFSYDTRKNKYFPSKALWASVRLNSNPEWLGALRNYGFVIIDTRYYAKGFGKNHVWAFQFYGQYSSKKAPDSGLPTLSGKSLLRGYPAGQYKAKYMSGAQTEYRYTIGDSRFRVVGFFGLANLSGGSHGVGENSRDDDGWYTCEGMGLRYKLQQVSGVDVRLDFVHTSKNELSFYLKLNQAF